MDCNPRCVEYVSPNKASIGGVRNAAGTFNVLLVKQASSVSDWVLERTTSDMNKSKRQLSPDISIAVRKAEVHWQVTSYWVTFKSGSLPPILGKTLTSRANHGTARPGSGSLRETHSQNGRIRDQVRSYGSTGNVSCRSALTFSQGTDALPRS